MIGVEDFEQSEYINMAVINQRKYNRIRGKYFMLMDSNTFTALLFVRFLILLSCV